MTAAIECRAAQLCDAPAYRRYVAECGAAGLPLYQVAQMLYEVPHHITRDGKPENFCLQQMNMPKAEDAARAIKALADGRQQTLSQ